MERPRRSIHPARNWNFESISLQQRVCKLSVPRRVRASKPMAGSWARSPFWGMSIINY